MRDPTAIAVALALVVAVGVGCGLRLVWHAQSGPDSDGQTVGHTIAVVRPSAGDAARCPKGLSRDEGLPAAMALATAPSTVEDLEIQVATLQSHLTWWEGLPARWEGPLDLPAPWQAQDIESMVEEWDDELDRSEVVAVDCSEPPCLVVTRVRDGVEPLDADEEWGLLLKDMGLDVDWHLSFSSYPYDVTVMISSADIDQVDRRRNQARVYRWLGEFDANPDPNIGDYL